MSNITKRLVFHNIRKETKCIGFENIAYLIVKYYPAVVKHIVLGNFTEAIFGKFWCVRLLVSLLAPSSLRTPIEISFYFFVVTFVTEELFFIQAK